MTEENTGFGKVKGNGGGGGKNFPKRQKLKMGSNIFRVIPPIKSLSDPGIWHKFYKQHFGYVIPGTPKKGAEEFFIPVPWECLEERNASDMIVVACPECKLVAKKKEELDSREIESAKMKGDAQEIFLRAHKQWLKSHNLDKKYYINVKMANGEFGYLALPWTAWKALKDRKEKVEAAEGISAIEADQGVWFEITRSGEVLDTTYTCDVVMESVDYQGKKLQCVKPAPLSKADFEGAMKDCADLATEVVRRVTMEQATALVSLEGEQGADPEAVAHLLNIGTRRGKGEKSPERSPKPVEPKAEPKPVEPVKVVKFEKPAPPPPVEEKAAPPAEEDEEARLMAALEAARKAKAARQQAAKVEQQAQEAVAKATETAFKKVTKESKELSDEEFLAVFSDPNKK